MTGLPRTLQGQSNSGPAHVRRGLKAACLLLAVACPAGPALDHGYRCERSRRPVHCAFASPARPALDHGYRCERSRRPVHCGTSPMAQQTGHRQRRVQPALGHGDRCERARRPVHSPMAPQTGHCQSRVQLQAQPPATPASATIEKKKIDLDKWVQTVEKPEQELYWRVLAYCTACRAPWCKLPWRKHTCLKGDAKAEGSHGNRCDMSWESYTDILTKSVPIISRQKAQVLTRECWRQGDADPSGIGVVTVAIVPRPAAEDYGAALSKNGIQSSVVPDSFYTGGPS